MRFSFLLYPGVEPIDLAAIGVVSMARRVLPELCYDTVAASLAPVVLSNGLRVLPDRTFEDSAGIDVLIVPGGPGWREASLDRATAAFLRTVAVHATLCSVCTGAMLLAEAGLLDGRAATTKHEVVAPELSPLEELATRFAGVRAMPALLVDEGAVVTGGGVTLCMDTVLHLLEARFGAARVDEVARIMEYQAARAANRARFPEAVPA